MKSRLWVKMTKNYKVLNDCCGLYEEEVFETVLKQRGIENPDEFLNPSEDNLLPLGSLKNIDKAYGRYNKAINNNEMIGILFDSDCDGVSSGTIMTRYTLKYTDNVYTFIDEGKMHGLINQDLTKFKSVDLLIIVDSLDKDTSQYKKLNEMGVDIIILDHHAINPKNNYDDYAILVSSQIDYDNPQLSGSGVVWKFCKYLDEMYLENYADEFIDLAACGIVADMMDMSVMENRYIVSEGLKEIHNPAIKKIVGSFEFNSTGITFSIAPLINASNRMNCNEFAMNAFLADDNKEVLKYVKELKKCKEDQNFIVDEMMPDVLEQCEKQLDKKMIVVFIDTIYGISGLFGNKLLERYQRPILILKDCENTYSGSMRAIGVDDFRKICNDSKLAQADGHELASGISIKKENFEKFLLYIEETLPELKFDSTITADIKLYVEDITRDLVNRIKTIDRVSGQGFKPVKFLIDGITEYEIGNMSGGKHLVVKPNDVVQIIKWNFNGSFDEYEDASVMNDKICAVVTLDSGFFGRKFVLKAICDEIEVV